MADNISKEARDAFDEAVNAENHNHETYEEDTRFARLGEQWPGNVRDQREQDKRPILTINKMPAFIRQVVNDARQNKPSITVHPVDSGADVDTSEIFSGLIRNIEYTSSADIAYDTAVDCAVTGGFGYFRIGLDFAHDDTFDKDLSIDRVIDPLTIWGDPAAKSADGSDWNTAFVATPMLKEDFKKKYPGATATDWGSAAWTGIKDPWVTDKDVLVAEWWRREEVDTTIFLMTDGQVLSQDRLDLVTDGMSYRDYLETTGVTIEKDRKAKKWQVKYHILTGAESIETRDWVGRYIPIVPVYGDEFFVDGKRYFRSLIRDAKDPQRMLNYWETSATELIALAPRVPFIGPKGFAKSDKHKWDTANSKNWGYLEYDGPTGPARQPVDSGIAAGSTHQAMVANDHMKSVLGIYDASLGARSNETSGKAILARQREGDVSTFHFIDNMNRSIRHAGRILIDLIPHVYNDKRIVRVLGEDGKEAMVPLGQPVPQTDKNGQPVFETGPDGQPVVDPMTQQPVPATRVYDLTTGKYDLAVKSGPSFTTRREEAAMQMTEMVRAVPEIAPIVLPMIAKNSDWPGADDLAEKLEALNPQSQEQGLPPEVEQQMGQMQEAIQVLQGELEKAGQEAMQLKAKLTETSVNATIQEGQLKGQLQVTQADRAVEMRRLGIDEFAAETQRFEAQTARIVAQRPPQPPRQPQERTQ